MTEPSTIPDPSALDQPIAGQEQNLRSRVLQNPGVRALIGARFLTTLGIATLSYGGMVYLATVNAPQLTISAVGGTRYLAALLFGIGGGALVEAMSKRTSLVTAYLLMGLACFLMPALFGTTVGSLVGLVFVVAALGQIAAPAVKAMTALVSTPAQVAVVAAVIALASGIGAALGSAFLAPILIYVSDLRTIIYVSGAILLVGALRGLRLPGEEQSASLLTAARQIDWRSTVPTVQRTATWLAGNRRVGALILVGAMVMAMFEGLNTLMPVFVRDVLQTDPANTVFILAPGGIGFLVGTGLGPWFMDRKGERMLAVVAFAILSLGFTLFGLIEVVAPILAPFSPLRLLGPFGLELTPQIQAAGLISILTALGSTAAIAAVQTYVNRYIMLAHQPATFAMQEVIENALILAGILLLGLVASLFGSRIDFLLAPPLILLVVIGLIKVAFRATDQDPPGVRAITRALFDTNRLDSERLPAEPDRTNEG